MSRINIEMEGAASTVLYEERGVMKSKVVSTDSLISSLVSQSGISSPSILPPGTRYFIQNGNSYTFFIEVPPIPRLINYVNGSKKIIFSGTIPMPWTLMKIVIVERAGTYKYGDIRVFAMESPLRKMEDVLFHFPAPNIYPEGNVCWGGTMKNMRPITELSQVGIIIDYFFSSEFNTDIHPRISHFPRYEDLLRSIKDKKTFPKEALVKYGIFNFITKH